MTLRQEDTGEIKYEVRSTKYEVAKPRGGGCGGRCCRAGKRRAVESIGTPCVAWEEGEASTKYEVKELGSAELRGHGGRRQSQNDVWGPDPCTREVGTHVAGGYMKRYSRGTTVHHK